MIGAICRHACSRKKPTKSPKRKLSGADDKLDYIPLETSSSAPISPAEATTFFPVDYLLIFKATIAVNLENCCQSSYY